MTHCTECGAELAAEAPGPCPSCGAGAAATAPDGTPWDTEVGWHDDPDNPRQIRYWNGWQWTQIALREVPRQPSSWDRITQNRKWLTLAGVGIVIVIALLARSSGSGGLTPWFGGSAQTGGPASAAASADVAGFAVAARAAHPELVAASDADLELWGAYVCSLPGTPDASGTLVRAIGDGDMPEPSVSAAVLAAAGQTLCPQSATELTLISQQAALS
jgi:hypothetical protein